MINVVVGICRLQKEEKEEEKVASECKLLVIM